MEPSLLASIWASLQPTITAGASIIGFGTIGFFSLSWLKKKGFIGEKHFDRRKDTSDVMTHFFRISEQNNKIIQQLVDINDEQKDILKSMQSRQTEIRDKINDIHGRVMNG